MKSACKIYLSLLATTLIGCTQSQTEDGPNAPTQEMAIAFNNTTLVPEQSESRSELKDVCDNFAVWGTKLMPDGSGQTVMTNYTVQWQTASAGTSPTNSAGWEYVGIIPNQTIKYWDMNASEYRFCGIAPASKVTSSEAVNNGATLNIKFQANALDTNDQVYYSRLWTSKIPSSWGQNPVSLSFLQPFSKVIFSFIDKDGNSFTIDADGKTSEAMPRYISNIRFYPVETDARIVTQGSITISYPIMGTASEPGFSATPQSGTGLEYLDTPDHLYTVFPATNQSDYEISLDVLVDEDFTRTLKATVPAEFMIWKPNMKYTYHLKLTDNYMEFIKVVQVASTSWVTQDGSHEIYNW